MNNGIKQGLRLSDGLVAAVWLVVVAVVAVPPLARWIRGDPPQVRIDPDAFGTAFLMPERAITIRLLRGGGADHAILFVPVLISLLFVTAGAVLVALFVRSLTVGDSHSRRAEGLAWGILGLLCAAGLGLPLFRGLVDDWVGGYGFVYLPDEYLIVAGLLFGACAIALRRGRAGHSVPPVT